MQLTEKQYEQIFNFQREEAQSLYTEGLITQEQLSTIITGLDLLEAHSKTFDGFFHIPVNLER